MAYKDFFVGQEVIYTGVHPRLRMSNGIVVGYNDDYKSIAVHFDEINWGHTCDGLCEPGKGWFCGEEELKPSDKCLPKIKISFDEFMKGER